MTIWNDLTKYLGISLFLHLGIFLALVLAFPPGSMRTSSRAPEVFIVSLAVPPRPADMQLHEPAAASAPMPALSSAQISRLKPVQTAEVPENDRPGASPAATARNNTNEPAASGEERQPQVQGTNAGKEAQAGSEGQDKGTRITERYTGIVVDVISRNRYYPDSARRRGLEGTVLVMFTIDRSGRAKDIQVKKSSGISILDNATIKILNNCIFPPPPKDTVTLSIPIVFQLIEGS